MNRRTLCVCALALVGLVAGSVTFAQERQGGDRGNRGGGGNFDPARFQEERLTRTKERLAVTEEEWQVLKPKIEKVWTAQTAAAAGMFGGGFGRGGRGGGGDDNRPRSAAETASRELRDLLENKDAPADQITAKLTALREARAKARAELQASQKELQAVLTPRQEAVLVSAGTLE